ncbi:FAD-dependent monooxygenase [Arthrobacter sp. StoSoilB22]|uniref:FAD-dependent oxidoreductase n=1 Tax=Arthrobacter sp. StoSoilB22 TaxID=2830996 RepID=UPI001CC74574|nr:FAD-dependent monooxygenase [Arthrobacter sp. StoSoilB22]BCW62874.1 pentachlorophenol monooxygenase [Arthrobacter sp. StoSoilB22]
MSSLSTEVAIVGGGPVGAMAAFLLAQQNIDVVLIDQNPEAIEDYRASTFHPATLDLLQASGVSDALVSMGLVCPVVQYRDRALGPVAELDLSILSGDTRFPYRLQCEQFKLTRWLHEQLATMPSATLMFSSDVTGVEAITGEGATVVSTSAGNEGRINARYVIGCDGARSTVRRSAGISFDGYTHPEQFLVAGTRFDFKGAMQNIQSVNYTSDPDEWFLLLEIPDMWRIVVPVPANVAADSARSEDYIQRCLQNICPSDEPYDILVNSVYRVHQRVAAKFRLDSVFLAGDAAHVNNPLGGMGLNGGLHDAFTLATGLISVLREGNDPGTLDRYEAIRRPVANNDINATTERNKKMMEERDPAVRHANNERLKTILADPKLAYDYALDASMIRSLRGTGVLSR